MYVSLFVGVKMYVILYVFLKIGRVRIRCYNGMKMLFFKNLCDVVILV